MRADHLTQPLGCRAIQEQLFEFIDRSLPDREMGSVEAHIGVCDICRSEFEQIRRAESALTAAQRAIPPAGDLYAGFARKLEASQPKRRQLDWRYIAPAIGFAMLALYAVLPRQSTPTTGVASTSRPTPPVVTSFRLTDKQGSDSLSAVDSILAAGEKQAAGRPVHSLAKNHRRAVGPRVALLTNARSRRFVDKLARNEAATQPASQIIAANIDGVSPSAATKFSDVATGGDREARNTIAALTLNATTAPDGRKLTAMRGAARSSSGFMLVVQDDVRGFTAETHDSIAHAAVESETTPSDGVRVEVEFDDGSAAALPVSGRSRPAGQQAQ